MPEPFVSKRAPIYKDVPDEKWNDWRWQLSNRLNSVEDMEQIMPLSESERKALHAAVSCANCQALAASGRTMAAMPIAFSLVAVPSRTRPAMPCRMAAMRKKLYAR